MCNLEWRRINVTGEQVPDWKAQTEQGRYHIEFHGEEEDEWDVLPQRYYAQFWPRDAKPIFTDEQAEDHFEAYGETISREDREVHPNVLGRFDIEDSWQSAAELAKQICEAHAKGEQAEG
jgi:hypothetical protein